MSTLESTRIDGVELICAESPEEFAAVRAMRHEAFRIRSGIEVADDLALDRRSFLFAARDADGCVAACTRVLLLPDPESGIAQLDHPLATGHGAATEVGRLAVAPDRSPMFLLAMMGLAAGWMLEHTPVVGYAAYCNHRLVPLYEQVGARDLGVDARHRTTGRDYRMVVGRYDDVQERALALLGDAAGETTARPPSPGFFRRFADDATATTG
jgi:hypothetical protein